MPSFSFIHLTVSEKKNFDFFFENLPFMWPHQPIKLSDLDKSRMKHGGLLNKHFCKKKSNIPNDLADIVNFTFPIISLRKLQVAIATRVLIRRKLKTNITFIEGNVLSKYAMFLLHPPYGF